MSVDKLFQLIRLPNLLMLAILQILLRYGLAAPVMQLEGRPMLLSTEEFIMLVFSCLCIAAGGYIVNDIEDVKIDTVNRPDTVLIGKSFSVSQAYTLYFIFSITGILIGFYLSYIARVQYVGTINAVTAGLLYFYATSYKCIPLLGNLIVSLLSALAVFIIAFPEPLILNHTGLFTFFTGFGVFSFLYTMARELVKDLEDQQGDHAAGCSTMVQFAGEKTTRILAAVVVAVSVILLITIQVITRQWEALLPFLYLLTLVILPSVWLTVKILRSRTKEQYHSCSNMTKVIMLAGIFSILIFYFSI